ncbi:MAG: glycosyltransferase family 4 protein [Acidimicrobiales bacterium]
MNSGTGRLAHETTCHNGLHGSDQRVEVEALTRNLRVAFFADAYLDYSLELAAELAPRVDLTVIRPAGWDELAQMQDPPSNVVAFPRSRMRDPRSAVRARRLVRSLAELPIDVLHVQASNNPWINLAMGSTELPMSIVQTVHDVTRHPGDRRTSRAGSWTARRWREHVDRFIVHTDGIGHDLTRFWDVPRDRWSVVPHGELGSCYRRHGVTNPAAEREDATVLFFGRIWPYKGLDVLIHALAATDRPTRLIIAGKGEPIDEYTAGLPSHVDVEVHEGFVDHEATLRLFERATIVCLPYREASQSGVAALAVGLGVPIVASNVGGIGETLRPEVDALLVSPDEPVELAAAIGRLLDQPVLRQRMSASQAERATGDMSWASIADQTLSVYRSVLR